MIIFACGFLPTWHTWRLAMKDIDRLPTKTLAELPEMLVAEEIADYLRTTRQTVHCWIRKGIIPSTRIGRVVRISKKDFQALLESSKTQGAKQISVSNE